MTNQPCFWPGGPKQPLPGSSGPGQMLHKYLSPGGATHILTIHLCVAPLGLDRYSPDNLRCLTAPARVVTALRACSTDSRVTCGRNINGIISRPSHAGGEGLVRRAWGAFPEERLHLAKRLQTMKSTFLSQLPLEFGV